MSNSNKDKNLSSRLSKTQKEDIVISPKEGQSIGGNAAEKVVLIEKRGYQPPQASGKLEGKNPPKGGSRVNPK